MEFDINSISAVLGVLGAYFAILLVLSVSVESILEPFSLFKGLQKQADPDEVVKAVQEWLPDSDNLAKAVAIQSIAAQTRTKMSELDSFVEAQAKNVAKALEQLKLKDEVDVSQKKIAIQLAALREKHAATQRQRITILRTLSGVIGIVIAFALQINTFDILGSFFDPAVMQSLDTQWGRTGGIIITGLAASAGSSFWHDMLGQVRKAKETVKQVDDMTGTKG